jgi:putative transposase
VSAYVDQHRERFGVEPICRTLGVSASAYYQRASGERSERAVEDERLLGVIRVTHKQSYEAYGYRRMWKALGRAGEHAPCCQVQRLMAEHGIQGAKRRGKPWRTTQADPAAVRSPDLVKRDFTASEPNRLWVADFTYLRCWEGVLYFSFVIDVFSRMVVGWQLACNMRRTLVLDALRMALGLRDPGADVALVHHSDAGSQPEFKGSSQHHLDERNCDGSSTSEVRSSRSDADVLAWSSAGGVSRAAAGVLGGDRAWCVHCGRGRRGGSVRGSWRPVVSREWRDAYCHSEPAVGALPVIRRSGGDRDSARPRVWRAGDRAFAGPFTVDRVPRVAPQCRHAQRQA